MAALYQATLLPFAKAPEVPDLVRLIDLQWFGSARPVENSECSEESEGRAPGNVRARNGSAGSLSSANSSGGVPAEDAAVRETQAAVPQLQRFRNRLLSAHIDEPTHQSLEGLGTWGARQQVFLGRNGHEAQGRGGSEHDPGADSTESDGDEQPVSASPSLHFGDAGARRQLPTPGSDRGAHFADCEEEERHHAWRWRFSKKWHMEQVRQQTETAPSKDEDEWSAAMDYMGAATTGGLNMQFGRTTSMERSVSTEPSMSQSLSLLLEAGTSAKEGSGLRYDTGSVTTPNATKRIFNAVRKAEELMAKQQEITRDVEARWQSTEAHQPWLGNHLPGVALDSWGSFQFVLVRAANKSTRRQKMLLRGRNGISDAAAFQALEQEVARAAAQHGLPAPRVELLGSGLMSWSRERERCLEVTVQKLRAVSADAGLHSKDDLARVAGALAQTGLSPTHVVFVNGERLPQIA